MDVNHLERVYTDKITDFIAFSWLIVSLVRF